MPGMARIDEYFKISRMSADEVIVELSTLARGDSKDKVRALALLSSHFGLLDGAGRRYGTKDDPVAIRVQYDELQEAINKVYGEVEADVATYNAQAAANNERIEKGVDQHP